MNFFFLRRRAPLTVICCYFNPGGYRARLRNFRRFIDGLNQRQIPWLAIEGVFDERGPELPTDKRIRRVPAGSVLWQKERLLNLARETLPPGDAPIAWLDADILFERADWAEATQRELEKFAVVQPFARVVRLGPDNDPHLPQNAELPSFAARYHADVQACLSGDFALHGHTGFAWAARRSVFADDGFYEYCIAGSGDHAMAHAFAGDFESACVKRIFGGDKILIGHFCDWARRIFPRVGGKIGYISGTILHLWHGSLANRRYALRNRELAAMRFDPLRDLAAVPGGGLRIDKRRTDIADWAESYFRQRNEDDTTHD